MAAFAGDLTGYWIGRVSGPRIMSPKAGRRFGGERWVRAQNRVNDSGMIAVATGRWLGFVRTLMPPVAGIVRMRVANFVIADLVGVVTWGTTILLVGYFAGAKLGATLMLSIGALIIVGLVAWWVVKRFRQPAAALADAVGEPPQETPVTDAGGGRTQIAAVRCRPDPPDPTRRPRRAAGSGTDRRTRSPCPRTVRS